MPSNRKHIHHKQAKVLLGIPFLGKHRFACAQIEVIGFGLSSARVALEARTEDIDKGRVKNHMPRRFLPIGLEEIGKEGAGILRALIELSVR